MAVTKILSDVQIVFNRGQDNVMTALPLSDGQLLVGFQSNGKAALYIDAKVNGVTTRFTVAGGNDDYESRISELEQAIQDLQDNGIAENKTLLGIDSEDGTGTTYLEVTEENS